MIRLGDYTPGRDNNTQLLRLLAATSVIAFHSCCAHQSLGRRSALSLDGRHEHGRARRQRFLRDLGLPDHAKLVATSPVAGISLRSRPAHLSRADRGRCSVDSAGRPVEPAAVGQVPHRSDDAQLRPQRVRLARGLSPAGCIRVQSLSERRQWLALDPTRGSAPVRRRRDPRRLRHSRAEESVCAGLAGTDRPVHREAAVAAVADEGQGGVRTGIAVRARFVRLCVAGAHAAVDCGHGRRPRPLCLEPGRHWCAASAWR